MACIFCKIINGEIPAKIIHQDDKVIAFADISPQAPVHILIVPKTHIPTILDLQEIDKDLVGHIYLLAKKLAIENNIDKSGFRVVTNCNRDAGQEVFHIHFHLLGGRKMGGVLI
ncbi:MAG: histidine triad nucleotide-binding protein [bacterium]